MIENFIDIIWVLLLIIISTLPLYLAVSLLGGKASVIKVFLVNIVVILLGFVIGKLFPYANIITFLLLIWIYHEVFRLKWLKAFLAWLLYIVFYVLLSIVFGVFGIPVYDFIPLINMF